MNKQKKIFIVSGEASGDMYGNKIALRLKAFFPDVKLFGMGGTKMREAGVDIIVDSTALAIIGVTQLLTMFFKIYSAFKKIKRAFFSIRPDLIIFIDYPDFNLRLAKAAKKANIKVLYYISPQIWAWRKKRIETIKSCVDQMAVILPFEADYYRTMNVNAIFVGHPLLDIAKTTLSPKDTKEKFNLPHKKKIIGLMPGSRSKEIKYLLPILLETAKLLQKKYQDVQFVLPKASSINKSSLQHYIVKYDLPILITEENPYDIMQICDAMIVASGTATLEVALIGTPMVIIYKVSQLNYLLAKLLISVPFLGLCNLIATKKIVPEFIQGAATPENIMQEMDRILECEIYRNNMITNLREMKNILQAPSDLSIYALIINMLAHN